jgi:hypothetical protein
MFLALLHMSLARLSALFPGRYGLQHSNTQLLTINDFNPQSSQQWHISCLNEETMALQDIKWLQTITRLPILVKGVLTAEDGKVFFASSY